CRRRLQREFEQLVLVLPARHRRQGPHLRIGQRALGKRPADRRQCLQRVRHPHLLARGAQADVAAPVQPLGAGLEAPREPAPALVEATDQHQQIVSGGVDAPREVHDGAVELVDRLRVVGLPSIGGGTGNGVGIHCGTSPRSANAKQAVIMSSPPGRARPRISAFQPVMTPVAENFRPPPAPRSRVPAPHRLAWAPVRRGAATATPTTPTHRQRNPIMKRFPRWLAVALCLTAFGCSDSQDGAPASTAAVENAMENPLLAEWTGPYGGVPAFDRMSLEHLKPAMERAMQLHLAEIEAIAGNPAPADFDNTILALERAGEALNRVITYYGIWRSNLSSPAFRELQAELEPKLSAHVNAIRQNEALFARVRAVYHGEGMAALRPDQRRLVQLVYDDFARNGATLEGAAKARYAEIEQRLAELHTRFANNVLADEEKYV